MADRTFLMECKICHMKMDNKAQSIGGDESCSHEMIPYFEQPKSPSPQASQKIVYPTDAERNWLGIIDDNKHESMKHTKKFQNDAQTLAQLRSRALADIKTNIQTLTDKLKEREAILCKEVQQAYSERSNAIKNNITALQSHKKQNEETKTDSEEKLVGSARNKEREKTIVSNCKKVIETTPQLQYVPTELRYEFSALSDIQMSIRSFGHLQTMPLASGEPCAFGSTVKAETAPNAGPKSVQLPSIASFQSMFDDQKRKVVVRFKLRNKNASEIKENAIEHLNFIKDNLKIEFECFNDDEDDEKEENEYVNPIHSGFSLLKDLNTINKGKKGVKYQMILDHSFVPETTIAFRIRCCFMSPDLTKFKNGQSSWTKTQSTEITEEDDDDDEKEFDFKLEFQGKTKTIKLNENDSKISNFDHFCKHFWAQFGKKTNNDDIYQIFAEDVNGNKTPLTDNAKLAKYADNAYTVKGNHIVRPKPEPVVARNNNNNNNNNAPGARGGGNNGGGGGVLNMNRGQSSGSAKEAKEVKQVSIIVLYKDAKKRMVLKKKKKELNIKSMNEKLISKFSTLTPPLSLPFQLVTASGDPVQNDDDIVRLLNKEAKPGDCKLIK